MKIWKPRSPVYLPAATWCMCTIWWILFPAKAAAAYVQNGEIETETVLPLAAGEGIGYTVPQHIRLDGVQKSVSVSFRVRRNYGPSTITVRCGPNKIAAFKRERLAPGEMEHITLPKALLQKADGPLIVAVEEVPQS